MGCGASKSPAVAYANGKPTFKGDEVVKGFNEGNGLLFRIVNNKKKQWAYYNDTTEYEMHVKVTFGEDCDIKALGKTHLEKLDSGEYLANVVVYPCETEMFIEGRVNGFKVRMDALPLSEEYRRQHTQRSSNCCS
ncbi:calpain-like cysteine peptidase [Trypanosoma conorhini]|uniref:Calpain-like cysteine peptidase n=1 Tax=Trypanosoma conorhini TaxID=83891 RepID=A0A3R7ND60_9TRYP|nr:calpain-like cysteine peptidase [Trypanosoma conorhini]RNF00914.1 calpain-like cysteine peptidase [Trypanosoma conorhini]